MGIAFSNENNQQLDKNLLRLPLNDVTLLVKTFTKHYFLPVLMKPDLHSLFQTAFLRSPNIDVRQLFPTIWSIFSQNEICSTLEVLVCLTLLCDGDWRERLELIFEIFKSPCTSDLTREDIMLGVEVTTEGLKKLWGVEDASTMPSIELAERREELQSLAESLAGAAFIKLGKESDDGIRREEFLNWAMERFKASKTIASSQGLLQSLS